MIKKFIFPLIAIILLSSCANKFSVQKRKYNKGFYLGVSNDKHKKSDHPGPAAKLKTKNSPSVPFDKAVETVIVSAPANMELLPSVKETIKKKNAHTPKEKKVLAAAAETKIISSKSFKALDSDIEYKIASSAAKKDSGAKLVLMIILCFFPLICLIPVYLHDNGITLNFWLTLILHLTFIGYIIYSLLVILDVVDLS